MKETVAVILIWVGAVGVYGFTKEEIERWSGDE
ncbi:hypothetical protein LaPh949_gp020 [Lactococcus phage 949]|uniref:Uncharacterized protein n=1 Tax=Lactococcus phage 949 TaxID=881953 RepID=E0YIQ7_9CAUD|nr:hypothetical protein LaPh949_gp020 [Lactococcus phage 949]ADM73578.1 hypothetical protein [Lactococcus phage 949]